MISDFLNHNVLCTTQNWFVAPDGKQYRAIWGKLNAIHEAGKELGFIPNRSHANWFYEIGKTIIMGCQILYLLRCDEKPNTEIVKDSSADEKGETKYSERPTMIYITA